MEESRVLLGFDMETDIGSWTPWYRGFQPGTEKILAVLEKHDVRTTFFFTADAARKNTGVLRQVAECGHEIGAHTLFHETIGEPLFDIPGMVPVLPEEVENRLRKNTQIIEELCGVRPVSFRCPRLFGSSAVVNALEKLGYKADVSYPMYYFKEQLQPYHPDGGDWTRRGGMKLVEIPNFADLSMKSSDPYGRDLDQWPLWRLEGAVALMEHVRNFTACVRARGVAPCLAFYMHPWEFHPMPEGLLHYGEGAVLPDPFIVKNCGPYAVEQFDLLLKLLKESGAVFRTARELADETPLTE